MIEAEYEENNYMMDGTATIKVIGMVVIADDVDEELAIKTIKSLKVFGVLKATPEIKKVLKQWRTIKLTGALVKERTS